MTKKDPSLEGAAVNTDRELYREDLEDPLDPTNYYSPRVFVTKEGKLGLDVGGSVIVMSIRAWHGLAAKRSGATTLSQRKE
jgi:hypothetical protein